MQDAIQDQFLGGVQLVWIKGFLSPRLSYSLGIIKAGEEMYSCHSQGLLPEVKGKQYCPEFELR